MDTPAQDFTFDDDVEYTGSPAPLRNLEAQKAEACPIGKSFFTPNVAAMKMGSKLSSLRARYPERVYKTKAVMENGVPGVRTWRFEDLTPAEIANKTVRKPRSAPQSVAPAAEPEPAPTSEADTADTQPRSETPTVPGPRRRAGAGF